MSGELEQLSRDVTELRVAVARIDGRLEAVPDHEKRIRVQEQWRWRVMGAAAGVSGAVSIVISALALQLHQ